MIDAGWIPELVTGLCVNIGALTTTPADTVWSATGYGDAEDRIRIYRNKIPAAAPLGLSVRFYLDEPMDPGIDMVHTSIQLRCRLGTDPLAGINLMGQLFTNLHEKSGLLLGKARASLIMGGGLAYLGADENDRHEYTQNYRIRGSGHLTV